MALGVLWMLLVAPVGAAFGPDSVWFIAMTVVLVGPFFILTTLFLAMFFLSVLIYGDRGGTKDLQGKQAAFREAASLARAKAEEE